MRSSDIFLVSVVTSTRSSRSVALADLVHQVVDLVAGSRAPRRRGSTIPVGRTICSTIRAECARSYSPGVADTNTSCGVIERNSSKRLRAVVQRARQPEAVVDERLLARAVALVHAADLRHGLVGLVDEADEVLGEVVDQAVRPLARLAAVEDPRVVLDPRAEAHLAQHLHVVLRCAGAAGGTRAACPRPRARSQRAFSSAPISATAVLDRALLDVVVRRRPDRDVLEVVLDQLAGERVEVLQALDLVAEQRRPEGRLGVGREHLERLAAHAEGAARQHRVVARVLDRDELAQQLVAVDRPRRA